MSDNISTIDLGFAELCVARSALRNYIESHFDGENGRIAWSVLQRLDSRYTEMSGRVVHRIPRPRPFPAGVTP